MTQPPEPSPVSLISQITIWMVVAVLAALVAPYIALSLYGFFNLDDVVFYEKVKTLGVLGTIDWYYRISIARFSVLLLSTIIAAITLVIHLNPLIWLKIWCLSSFAILFGSLWVLIRTMVPRLSTSGAIIFVLLPLAPLMAFAYEQTGDFPELIMSENILPWVLSIYTTGPAVFALLMATMVVAMETDEQVYSTRVQACFWVLTRGAGWLLALVFFFLTGMHELFLIAMGLFLALLMWVTSKRSRGAPFSRFAPFRWMRIGRALREDYDRPFFVGMIFWLGVLLVVSSVIQLAAPSTLLRQEYLPAQSDLFTALWRGVFKLADLYAEMFSWSQPEFLLSLVAVFAIIRTQTPRRSLAARNSLLLPSIIVPLSVGWVGISLNLMQEDGINGRTQYFTLLLTYISVFCLAVYTAAALPPRFISRKAWLALGVLSIAGVIYGVSANPRHREAVKQALGSGTEYARGAARRVDQIWRTTGDTAYVSELVAAPTWVSMIGRGTTIATLKYFNAELAIIFNKKKVVFYSCRPPTSEANCDRIIHPVEQTVKPK